MMKRRNFLLKSAQSGIALSTLGLFGFHQILSKDEIPENDRLKESLFFKISLAQWSLHKALKSKKIDPLDFAAISRNFGCEGLEYVNSFFLDKARNTTYLNEMNTRAKSEGQQNVLIMIDGEGNLADANTKDRMQGIENHYKWVDAAHYLGCHAIRVNLAGGKHRSDAIKSSVDSLNKLSEFAKGSGINILVENHGGFSSDGNWMAKVFSQVQYKNCGTLPDFGNFCLEKENSICVNEYDRYKGLKQLLPFAKAVSAKSYDFDQNGNETTMDYYKIMKMVKEEGYTGFVGIEFEGNTVSEEQGIQLTRDLLIKVGRKLG